MEVYKDSIVDEDEFDFDNTTNIYHISKILLLEQGQNMKL